MPPSHPRTEDVLALSEALARTGEHAESAGDELLEHLVTVGDQPTQAALEELVDTAVDGLRELTATCRELTLPLAADLAPGRSHDHDRRACPERR